MSICSKLLSLFIRQTWREREREKDRVHKSNEKTTTTTATFKINLKRLVHPKII